MARRDETLEQPGNDGSWFVEAVAPELAGNGSVAGDGTSITETTLELDQLSEWEPEEPRSLRRFLIPAAIILGLIAVGLVVLTVWMTGSSERTADELADNYSTALVEMQAVLPQTQQILGNVTDPFNDPESLPRLEPLLADLDATAGTVLELASEPLPDPAPLSSPDPLTALEPTREAMGEAGQEGLAISQRISDGLNYRVLLQDLIVLPDLPTVATATRIEQLETELAASLDQANATLELLPTDPAFAGHREFAAAAVDEYAAWQPRYLDSLRNENPELASALIVDVEQLVTSVESALVPSLAQLRTEVDAQLLALDDLITTTVAAIP